MPVAVIPTLPLGALAMLTVLPLTIPLATRHEISEETLGLLDSPAQRSLNKSTTDAFVGRFLRSAPCDAHVSGGARI
jgi:hypothetical protein